ncbi:hypothetical protein [Methylorubrum sp. SB2]|uniref:hypothetical protein n=1 Tax=Methylorubrum subtropicum TaxID=3138812 RepID=UPI00313F275E
MTNTALQLFCDRIVEAGRIDAADVAELSRDILADGIMGRHEADLLLALDRAVADQHEGFSALLTVSVVDFAVYGERPTGRITPETAAWLSASLAGRKGPTPTGARIAMEIVREATVSDEALIAFALKAKSWNRQPVGTRTGTLPLAA